MTRTILWNIVELLLLLLLSTTIDAFTTIPTVITTKSSASASASVSVSSQPSNRVLLYSNPATTTALTQRRFVLPSQRQQQQQQKQRNNHHYQTSTQTKRNYSSTSLQMALVPLPVNDVDDLLVVGPPSGPQYAIYWGRTKRERYNRFLESSIVTMLGVFFSYFLSFVVGGFVATIFGCLFAFWGILSPEFKARQRNWEFLGGRRLVDQWMIDPDDDYEDEQGLYGSLYFGKIDDVCVVEDTASRDEFELEDFQDYSMNDDELEQIAGTPYLLRLRVSDSDGRELQIHARMTEDYLDIQKGMPVLALLLSTSQSFSSLAALTDIFVPDADCFVGDYPYLNQPEVEALLAEDDELWDLLRSQGTGKFDISTEGYDSVGSDYDDRDEDFSGDLEPVPVRRRRRKY